MNSWVYILSQFTPEALLFEALLIFLLACGYATFWVLRKRRYGAIDANLPSGPVKVYLNELIVNAEQLRAQLFGLLSGGQMPYDPNRAALLMQAATAATPAAGAGTAVPALGGAGDPDLLKKLAAMEAKLNEQTRAMESVGAEKTRLEKDLADAKAASSKGGGDAGGADVSKLQQRIQDLESKLAEYNVIEDDLANLKRLQQENTQLKAQLAGKGIAPAPAAAAPTAPVPTPAAQAEAVAAAPAAVAAAVAESAAEPAAAAPAESFDALAGQVEQSLQATPAAASGPSAPAGATAAPPDAAAAPAAADGQPPADAAAAGGAERTDADLVAEFEKMLKG